MSKLGNISAVTAIPSVAGKQGEFIRHLRQGDFSLASGDKVKAETVEFENVVGNSMNTSPLYVSDMLFDAVHQTPTAQGLLIPSVSGVPFYLEHFGEYFPAAVEHAEVAIRETFGENTTSSFSPINVGNNCRLVNCKECFVLDEDALILDKPNYIFDRKGIPKVSNNIELVDCSNVFIYGCQNVKLTNCHNMIVINTNGVDLDSTQSRFIYEGEDYENESEFHNALTEDESQKPIYIDPYDQCSYYVTTWASLTLAGKKMSGVNVDFGRELSVISDDDKFRFLTDLEGRMRQKLTGTSIEHLQAAFLDAVEEIAGDGLVEYRRDDQPKLEGPGEKSDS